MNDNINTNSFAVHARPTASFSSPAVVYCHTFLRQREIDIIKEKLHLKSIVDYKQLNLASYSPRLSIYTSVQLELRVETHHEFVCYILILNNNSKEVSTSSIISDVPEYWREEFPGKLLTQCMISFSKSKKDNVPLKKLNKLFGSNQIIGNFVERESARIWTDFYAIPEQDTLCVHVEDFTLGPKRRGRLAQHILELENYRCLSEIAFPVAEEIVFEIEKKEMYLSKIIEEISLDTQTIKLQGLLHQLLDLSVSSEHWRSRTGHRFSATTAYKNIFLDRLSSLEDAPVLGYQSFASFLSRTTMPTFRTCEAANDRLNIFISRIDRAISLLSTSIRSTVEQQNNILLMSVDNQNGQQVKLQKTIEAFAIIAISYNGSSLINLFLQSLKNQGAPINISFWTMISIPLVILSSYGFMLYLRKRK